MFQHEEKSFSSQMPLTLNISIAADADMGEAPNDEKQVNCHSTAVLEEQDKK